MFRLFLLSSVLAISLMNCDGSPYIDTFFDSMMETSVGEVISHIVRAANKFQIHPSMIQGRADSDNNSDSNYDSYPEYNPDYNSDYNPDYNPINDSDYDSDSYSDKSPDNLKRQEYDMCNNETDTDSSTKHEAKEEEVKIAVSKIPRKFPIYKRKIKRINSPSKQKLESEKNLPIKSNRKPKQTPESKRDSSSVAKPESEPKIRVNKYAKSEQNPNLKEIFTTERSPELRKHKFSDCPGDSVPGEIVGTKNITCVIPLK